MQGLGCQLKSQSVDRQHSPKLETVSSNQTNVFFILYNISQILCRGGKADYCSEGLHVLSRRKRLTKVNRDLSVYKVGRPQCLPYRMGVNGKVGTARHKTANRRKIIWSRKSTIKSTPDQNVLSHISKFSSFL